MKNIFPALLFCLFSCVVCAQSAKQLSWSKPPLGQPTAKEDFKARGVSQREIRDRLYRFGEQKLKENRQNYKDMAYEDKKYYMNFGLDEDVKVKPDQLGLIALSFYGSKEEDPFGYQIKVGCEDGAYSLKIVFLANDSKFVLDDSRNATGKENYERFIKDLDNILTTIENVINQKAPSQEQKEAVPPARKKLGE